MARSLVRPAPMAAPAALLLLVLVFLLTAPRALAAPVTIDFESGAAANEQVTNQYCCPGGVDKGPTFLKGTEAGFNAGSQPGLSGLSCGPPFLDAGDQANSGTRAISLVGCATGEFTHSAAFFKLNWPTDSVEFQVGLPSETPGSCSNFVCAEIWTTGFRADGSIVMQQQTLLGPNTKFKAVPVISSSEDIAFVSIERGTKETPTDSDTGVMLTPLSAGSGYLVVDDLTYDPPSSPPESSFVLGASPASVRLAPGTKSPQVKVPITWIANPNPASSPVSLELSAPSGLSGTFTPNPSTTGTSTLVLEAEKSVTPGKYTVTVDGYVDKGEPSEKHASVEIPVEVTEPFTLDPLGKYRVSRCTPVEVPIRIPKDPGISDPFNVYVRIPVGSAKFIGTSAGSIADAHHVAAELGQAGNEAKMSVTVGVDPGVEPQVENQIQVEVAPSGYAPRTSVGSIAIEPIRFDSLSPGNPQAPQLGNPGTLVTAKGAGFCPGDKLAIGPDEDAANPESISTPGNTMTFRIPRGAVSGPLKVMRLSGKPIVGPQVQVSSFRNTRGFSWENKDYGMQFTGEMMDELYGVNETNIEVFGWLIRKPEAGLLGEITNKFIHGGICFGMAFGVAQMFDSPNWVFEFPRSANTVWGLNEPEKPSNGLLRFVTERFSLQFSDEVIPIITGQLFGQSVNAHDPSTDVNEIRSLVGPQKPPLLLGMVSWQEGFGAHTVIAYDWEAGPNDTTIVYVYNPNAPYTTAEEGNWGTHTSREFTQSQVVINNSDSHWVFAGLGKPGHPWEGSDNNLILFPHGSLPILNGKSPHVPNVLVAASIDLFGAFSDAVTEVSDDEGHQLLDNGVPTEPRDWPDGVAPFASFTGSSGPLQAVTADTGKTPKLTATVRRGKGGGAMELALPGARASLQADVHPGQVDHVTVNGKAGEIGYSPGATTSYGGVLVSSPSGGSKSSSSRASASRGAASKASAAEHLVHFQTTSSKGGGDTVSFARGRAFEIDHDGSPAALSLTLSAFGAKGLPVAVRLPKVHLARGEKLTAAPANWRRLGSTSIRLTSKLHRRTATRLVRGRRLGRRFAAIRSAKLDAAGSHVNLRLRLKRPPRGASLSPVVDVLRGGRVVSSSKPAQFSGAEMARPSLALKKRLGGGRLALRVRLLETTAVDGLMPSSVVVRKRLLVRAHKRNR